MFGDRPIFCSNIDQVAFTLFGEPVGLVGVIGTGLFLTLTVSLAYRLATRYGKRRYGSDAE